MQIAFGVEFPFVYSKLRAAGDDADRILDLAEITVRRALERTSGRHRRRRPWRATWPACLPAPACTLALAESCTGGLIAAQLTDIPGASAFLERGAVTYANSAKMRLAGGTGGGSRAGGRRQRGCARAMARGIRRAAGSDLGLAVTGIAGPAGGTPQKPVGTVFLALCAAQTEQVKMYRFAGDREQIRQMAACTGLDWLRRYALERLENALSQG